MEQVLEKETLPGASAKSSADDLLRFQSDADVTIQIEQALAWLRENQIAVPQPADVRDYLARYPDMIAIIPSVCKTARQKFHDRAKLYLEVYHDPEIDDEYLALYVRQKNYQDNLLDIIEEISKTSLYEQLVDRTGWLTVTTDFRQPG